MADQTSGRQLGVALDELEAEAELVGNRARNKVLLPVPGGPSSST